MEADKKAYEKFEKGKAKTTVEAKPKEGVTSERFESKYWMGIMCVELYSDINYWCLIPPSTICCSYFTL